MRLLIQHGERLLFWCPGCKCGHQYQTVGTPVWQWNGSMDKPTFTPSLLVNQGTQSQCHLFVTNGMIQFCADSSHGLKGQTVPMVDWDTILKETPMQEETQKQADPTASATAPGPAGPVSVNNPTAAAAAPGPVAPPPHPGFDQAVAYMEKRGYSHSAAIEIVNIEGIEVILASIPPAARETAPTPTPSGTDAPLPSTTVDAPTTSDSPSSNEGAKQEDGPPEPGMKRCPTCKTWYPGGYENCPHCNTRL